MWWWRRRLASTIDPSRTIGLDLHADHLCAVRRGPEGVHPLQFDHMIATPPRLPLCLALHKRRPLIGQEAVKVFPHMPHLIYDNFLPNVGQSPLKRCGRHQVNADIAMQFVFKHIRSVISREKAAITAALPPYLSTAHADRLSQLMRLAELPLRATLPAPLALAGAAFTAPATDAVGVGNGVSLGTVRYAPQEPFVVGVVDVDSHALTASIVLVDPAHNHVRLHDVKVWTKLNLQVWNERLLRVLTDHTIRRYRRDLRYWPEAEQCVLEQLPHALQHLRTGQQFCFAIRTDQWEIELPIAPQDLQPLYRALTEPAAQAIGEFLRKTSPPISTLWLSLPAGSLPGLWHHLGEHLPAQIRPHILDAAAIAHAAALLKVYEPGNAARWETSVPLTAFAHA